MNRREFFQSLVKDLTDTGREIAAPFIESDIKKIEQATDMLQGIEWHRLDPPVPGYQEQFIGGRLISLFAAADDLRACSKACPNCRGILQWHAYARQLVCSGCGQAWKIAADSGLTFYSLKKADDVWWVALPAGVGDA
ncbi:MAG: Rieske (2Fe-2S) protein [Sporolactobacillus sp.]|jgi:hypothetical protein|nr:Rieske (2Fe-2S) protein [Sporolactobacillus sp.]